MDTPIGKRILSVALCLPLIAITTPVNAGTVVIYQQAASPASTTSDYAGQGAPATPAELQALVAPIALYPDALVAQILSASTFPDQVAIADNWLETNKSLTGTALTNAVDAQSWDPSVKALTQFPDVLNKMAQSLAWTSQLGEAYHNQQADVMTAVQTLRAQAKAAGNLKSGPQIQVVQQSPQTIIIQPTNPQVVYVPVYNPAVIYGTTYVTPGYSTGDLVAASVLSFGAGMAVGAMISGGWGYSSWNCNWHGGVVYYHGGSYYGNSAWHGGYYGGGYNNAYHNTYDNSYHNNNYNNNSQYHNNNYNQNSYNSGNHNTNISGNTVNTNHGSSGGASSWGQGDKSGGWGDSSSSRGWGQSGSGRGSTAFSGFSGGSGSGWQSRSSSARGWGSRGGGGGWGSRGGGFGGRR